jgi:hypothetical protein
VAEPQRPALPAHLRAQLARLDADLAAARIQRQRLASELERAPYAAGCRQPAALELKLANVNATIAELEARREDIVAPPPEPTCADTPVAE